MLEVAGTDKRERTLIKVKLGSRIQTVPATHLWAVKEKSANAIVLDDNREWYDDFVDSEDED